MADAPSVNVHKDPVLWLILVDLALITLPEVDRAIQAGTVSFAVISHIVIQGIISVIRLRSGDVITGLSLFDKR